MPQSYTKDTVISPIGNDVKTFIENVKNGKCGIDNITAFDNTGYKTRVAAEVKDFNPKEFEISGSKKKDKFVQYAAVDRKSVV